MIKLSFTSVKTIMFRYFRFHASKSLVISYGGRRALKVNFYLVVDCSYSLKNVYVWTYCTVFKTNIIMIFIILLIIPPTVNMLMVSVIYLKTHTAWLTDSTYYVYIFLLSRLVLRNLWFQNHLFEDHSLGVKTPIYVFNSLI